MASDKRDPSTSDAEIQRRVRGRAEAIRKARAFAQRRAKGAVANQETRPLSGDAQAKLDALEPELKESAAAEQELEDFLRSCLEEALREDDAVADLDDTSDTSGAATPSQPRDGRCAPDEPGAGLPP